MSVPATLAGVTYQIPETGEVGWGDQVTNYLVALSNSLLKTDIRFKTRRITVTPASFTATDVVAVMNVASASAITLPAGITDRVYIVADGSGAAETNNITVSTSAGQLINGATSYVIKENFGFLFLVFDGVQWNVIAEGKTPIRSTLYRLNDATNASFVEQSVTRNSTPGTAADLESCSADFVGSEGIEFVISLDSGESIRCSTSFNASRITALSDHDNLFLLSDAGTGIYVSKSAASATITVKNRMGSSKDIEIKALTNRITNATAWA